MFLLDTNAWVAVLRGKSPEILAQLKRHAPTEIALCPIVLAELWYGVCRSDPAKRSANEALVRQLQTRYVSAPFDDAAAVDAGQIRAELAATGTLIGPYDLLIAAIARSQHLTLVTHNAAEFSRVPGCSSRIGRFDSLSPAVPGEEAQHALSLAAKGANPTGAQRQPSRGSGEPSPPRERPSEGRRGWLMFCTQNPASATFDIATFHSS